MWKTRITESKKDFNYVGSFKQVDVIDTRSGCMLTSSPPNK